MESLSFRCGAGQCPGQGNGLHNSTRRPEVFPMRWSRGTALPRLPDLVCALTPDSAQFFVPSSPTARRTRPRQTAEALGGEGAFSSPTPCGDGLSPAQGRASNPAPPRFLASQTRASPAEGEPSWPACEMGLPRISLPMAISGPARNLTRYLPRARGLPCAVGLGASGGSGSGTRKEDLFADLSGPFGVSGRGARRAAGWPRRRRLLASRSASQQRAFETPARAWLPFNRGRRIN